MKDVETPSIVKYLYQSHCTDWGHLNIYVSSFMNGWIFIAVPAVNSLLQCTSVLS